MPRVGELEPLSGSSTSVDSSLISSVLQSVCNCCSQARRVAPDLTFCGAKVEPAGTSSIPHEFAEGFRCGCASSSLQHYETNREIVFVEEHEWFVAVVRLIV